MNCKKFPLDRDEFQQHLSKVEQIFITKGKKLLSLDPNSEEDLVLDESIGRSGNLRAPTIRHGKTMIVGFSEAAYQQLLAGDH